MSVVRHAAPRPAEAARSAVPEGTLVYAIGDIHGRADLLAELHGAILGDAASRPAGRRVLVYLGDYVSRAPGARAVLEALVHGPPPGFERVMLKGNHEELVLRFLGGELPAGRHWLEHGGGATLGEYGIESGDPLAMSNADYETLRQRLEEALPAAHAALLRVLRLSHREGDYCFVHAGVRPGVALAEQQARDLTWIRRRFLESDAEFGAVIVHGHTICSDPEVRRNRIGIDTGAFESGVLTCLALRGDEREFIQAVRR
jgi:serine/threonine protein phosphatase 1